MKRLYHITVVPMVTLLRVAPCSVGCLDPTSGRWETPEGATVGDPTPGACLGFSHDTGSAWGFLRAPVPSCLFTEELWF